MGCLVERLWNIGSYGTLHKGDPKLLPKSDSYAINIIVCIGVLPPLKNTPALFLTMPRLNLQTVQASPPFWATPRLYWFFVKHPPKNRIFQWNPKYVLSCPLPLLENLVGGSPSPHPPHSRKEKGGGVHTMDILTTTSKENNRYSVGLLRKEYASTLPNNRALAISRMISLKKKFGRQPELHTQGSK